MSFTLVSFSVPAISLTNSETWILPITWCDNSFKHGSKRTLEHGAVDWQLTYFCFDARSTQETLSLLVSQMSWLRSFIITINPRMVLCGPLINLEPSRSHLGPQIGLIDEESIKSDQGTFTAQPTTGSESWHRLGYLLVFDVVKYWLYP